LLNELTGTPREEAPEQKKARKREFKQQNSRNTRSREITCSWYFCSEREVQCSCVWQSNGSHSLFTLTEKWFIFTFREQMSLSKNTWMVSLLQKVFQIEKK